MPWPDPDVLIHAALAGIRASAAPRAPKRTRQSSALLSRCAMNLLELATLVITGFVSCAEFGFYAFVHPVLRRLPQPERIAVEQGLLHTFGRSMPVGMILCVVLSVTTAISSSRVCRGPRQPRMCLRCCLPSASTSRSTVPPGNGILSAHPRTESRPVTAGSSSRQSDPGFSSMDSLWSAPQQPFEPADSARQPQTKIPTKGQTSQRPTRPGWQHGAGDRRIRRYWPRPGRPGRSPRNRPHPGSPAHRPPQHRRRTAAGPPQRPAGANGRRGLDRYRRPCALLARLGTDLPSVDILIASAGLGYAPGSTPPTGPA